VKDIYIVEENDPAVVEKEYGEKIYNALLKYFNRILQYISLHLDNGVAFVLNNKV